MASTSAGLFDSIKYFVLPERTTLSFRRIASKVKTNTKGLVAGVGVADITPRPGVPKGGYAAMANFGNGFRTRLRVRSFYIDQEGCEPIVIVQADLHAGSSIIRDKVAELVAEKTNVESNNLCMTCTHTHSGPGQLLDSDFYNAFASNKPGFDPELYDFVVAQIVASVMDAFHDRKPAKIATGSIGVWHATRNRALDPYLTNPGKSDKTTIYDAINPSLFMVRIDQQGGDGLFYPKAAISCFSIHGTTVPASEKLNNADVWAYICQELQWKIQRHYETPWDTVHGAFQGTHGDIAPNIKKGQAGFKESRRIGCDIAEKAWELFSSLENKLESTISLASAIREVDFYKEAEKHPGVIASRPVLGTALTAGAYENETPFLYNAPLFKHGAGSARSVFTKGEQGHKRWVASYLQFAALPKKEFPHKRQLQVLNIGDFVMLALPFEVSVEAGRRFTASVDAVLEASDIRHKQVFVTSLANGYTGYTVTPEEYARQFYEGGHTLYGPKSTPFLAEKLASIVEDLTIKGNFADLPLQQELSFKTCHYFEPIASTVKTKTQVAVLNQPVYQQKSDSEEECWSFHFFDRPSNELNFNIPLLRIEVCGDNADNWSPLVVDGRAVNDQGYDIALRVLEAKDHAGRERYLATWYNSDLACQDLREKSTCERLYRFVYFDQVNGVDVASAAFSLVSEGVS
ncbi:hypothetical protein A9Q81_16260 [Gammaproteobacteria bacterium 42_54_T18]|nr:hypothetical protein A9Q81_16260 [Gammaproteobacteria bacterium 42_54_T18]